jgi:signal transduction histidine kinase
MPQAPPSARQLWLESLADLSGAVAHDFNNLLNNILLQVAVVELSSPGSAPGLATIRRLGVEGAAMVRQFQQLSEKEATPLEPVDLNPLVRETLAEVKGHRCPPDSRLSLSVATAPHLPAVLGNHSDLKRLLRLLVESSAEAIGSLPGSISLCTEEAAACIQLRIEDTGPAVPTVLLSRLFEAFSAARPGATAWKLAACKALVRRLHGTIQGGNRPEGGVSITVGLQPA